MANPKIEVDLALSVMCAVVPTPITFSNGEIADVCGCSRQTIEKIYRRAMKKVGQSKVMKQHVKEINYV